MPRYSLRGLLILVTAIGCCSGVLRSCYVELTHVETAENVKHVDWLPKTATNVSYFRSYAYTAYEFDISEPEFRRWTSLEVKPISKPVTIARYSLMTRQQSELPPDATPAQFEAWEAERHATVADGFYYENRRGNGGGVSVAFDRTKGRVYFQTNPR